MSTAAAPAAPRSGRRFWTTVAVFALVNVAAWFVWDRHFAAAHCGTLRMVSVDPGDNAAVAPSATVRWHFDADVIPTDVYARPPGQVVPAVAGRWQWESPRTLAFVPAVGLPRATPVTFTLASDLLRTGTGARLDRPCVTRVRPDPLAVRSVRQSAVSNGDQYVIDLAFTDRVAPGDVLAHLTATRSGGTAVACHLLGQATGNLVRLRTDRLPPFDNGDVGQLTVAISPGLVGAAGPLGLDQPYTATVDLARSLAATAVTPESSTRGRPYLMLSFNGEVDPAVLREVLTVDPPVPFTLEQSYQGVTVTGDFRPGQRYTLTLAAPKPGTPDAGRYPRPGSLPAVMPDLGTDCWFDTDQGYLSTAGNRTLLAHVVNVSRLHVTVTRVYDDNLVAWRNALGHYGYGDDANRFARPAADRRVTCPGPRNVRRDVRLSLDDLLPPTLARSGAWRVAVTPDDVDDRAVVGSGMTMVTLSDVGLTAKRTRDGLVAWATSLRSAAPLPGIRVRAYTDKNQLVGTATTGPDGLARMANVLPAPGESVAVLLADAADQLTWLDLRKTAWDLSDTDTAGQPYLRAGHAAFVYADRGVYRPGETVHLRAIVRGPGDVAPKRAFPVRWRFRRPDLHDWRTVNALLDVDGASAADVPLPADPPTGQWSADVALPGDDAHPFGSASFLVEEFVPNRLKVGLAVGGPGGRYALGTDPLPVDVTADYLFGRPAAGLDLDLSARAAPVTFAPTAWAGWTFGDAADTHATATSPHLARRTRRHKPGITTESNDPGELTATLDDNGKYHGTVDVGAVVHTDEARANRYRGPWLLTVTAGVREAGGRAVTAAKQVDVDDLPAYVGVRRSGDAPTPGRPVPFALQLVEPDGSTNKRTTALSLRLFRATWNTSISFRDGQYHYDSTRLLQPVASATVHADANGAAQWSPTPADAGAYVLEATDIEGGAVTTTAFYATNGDGWDDTIDQSHPDQLDVRVLGPGEPDVPGTDARTRPAAPPQPVGSRARVLVAAPFAGRLLLTVETDEVVQSKVIDMDGSHVVVPIDVTAACRPGAFVTATVVRPVDPNTPWRPHRAFGVARLNIDPADRKLTVAIETPKLLQPMRSLDVGLTVTDPAGRPAADAAVTVAAVDEGICSLTDVATPDPLAFFTAPRALGVDSADLYGLLMPEAAKPDVGGDASGADVGSRHRSPIGGHRVRPVALAWATVHTDAAGHARASFPVPAFQGQLRVMAVAYTADRVGSADRGVTVRSPLLAQTSWPRFAAPGDRFTVPVVLFNNTPAGGTAEVTVTSADDLLSIEHAAPTVALAAGGQARTDVAVSVGAAVGIARVHLTASMNGEQFVEDLELPIRPAAVTTQVGGIVRGGPAAPVSLDRLVPMVPGTASVRVDVTPWPTLNLPKGLDYLDRYPYGCVEQTTSTLFPLVALGEIGRAVDPARFDPDRIRRNVADGIVRLLSMQTADGGLAMWTGESDDWPWGSVYAAHFLTVARAAGYAVPDDFYDRLVGYVRHQLDQGVGTAGGVELQAYAAYVMALADRPDRPAMSRLAELATAAPSDDADADEAAMRGDARLFLSLAQVLAGRRDLAEGLLPAATPAVRATRQHDGNLGSAVRDRALTILALEDVDPDRPDLPDLVQQLADTPWASTQDVAFSVLAIGQYLQSGAGRHRTPYDAARLLAGSKVLADSRGGAPLSWTGTAAEPLRVELTGPADAVGHIGWLQTGVPLSPQVAASHGLTVHRRYLRTDGSEVHGPVRSGDLVRVELTIDGPAELPNVVMEDLLPAGLEVENARLASAAHPSDPSATDDQGPPVFGGMTDVRDDRVIIVGRISSTGHGRAEYLARAVTPGEFVAPPTRAEAMYDLNTNAVTGTGTFTVVGAAANVADAR